MFFNMKTISLNVSNPVYKIFQEESARRDRPTSELIREAMEDYLKNRCSPRLSLADLKPLSLGKPLVPIDWSEDVFEEMLP
jgi:hypothetical protein